MARRRGAPTRPNEKRGGAGERPARPGRPNASKPNAPRPGERPARPGTPSASRPATRGRPDLPLRADARKAPGDRAQSIERVRIEVGKPLDGEWLWTTRAGVENDLLEELNLALGRERAIIVGPALVRSKGAPTTKEGDLDLTFARQGFRLAGEVRGDDLARAAADAIAKRIPAGTPWTITGWVPDTDATNPLAPHAEALEAEVKKALTDLRPITDASARPLSVELALTARDHAFVGTVPSDIALSDAPGGRARMRLSGERPSRAARKVEEALAWLNVSPGAGEVCVDLGAAPGGWSWVLLQKRAKVIAVDPAELRSDIASNRSLVHHKASAFQFAPDEPVDWLFCDMAWKPLEVAQLIAKWGRRRWTRLVVANLKLPMKTKAATVADLKQVIAGGGWQRIRTRQLYHDRDEITLTAHL